MSKTENELIEHRTRYIWRLKKRLPERYGTLCRVVARAKGPGPRNIMVAFDDGYRVITTWHAVKKIA